MKIIPVLFAALTVSSARRGCLGCPKIFLPVCAVDVATGEDVNFPNKCELELAINCGGRTLVKKSDGVCGNENPPCYASNCQLSI